MSARAWGRGVAVVAGVSLGAWAAPAEAATSHTAYVTDTGLGVVIPVDTATNTAGAPIAVGSLPTGVAITPDGKTVYVTSSGSDSVTPIDAATNTPGAAITVGSFPGGVAITPDGKTAYVVNQFSNSVTPLDTATNKPGPAIGVGSVPFGVAITPDGKTAYVTNSGSDSVTPIDTATNKAGTAIPVGKGPTGVAITPDGKTVYVTDNHAHLVTPIATATNKPGAAIPVGGTPQGIAVTPDGKTAYVANSGSDSVTPIATATNTPGPTITVSSPLGIAVTPDQGPVAAFTAKAAPVGQPWTFDGSGSLDSDGRVVSYHWDFGDGSSETTASPMVMHTYAATATPTVTLRVVDDAGCSTAQTFTGQTVSCNGSAAARVTHALSPYAAGVLDTAGLAAYWRLGERSGSTAVDELRAHDGSYEGGVTLGVPGAVAHDPNTAVSLNGSTGKVQTPSLGTATEWTVEGWTDLKPSASTNPNGNNVLYAGHPGVRLIIRPAGVYADDWTHQPRNGIMQPRTPSNLNQWVYWALVRTGSSLTLYRNATAIAHSTLTTPGPSNLNGTLGAQNGIKYFLHGAVDEVAVYDTALTPATIAHHYQLATTG